MKLTALGVVLALVLPLAGCGDGSSSEASGPLPGAIVSGAPQKTANGVEFYDVKVGDGPAIKGAGTKITIHYTGWVRSNNRQFYSTVDRNEPEVSRLDKVHPIGLMEGIQTMRQGGKRKLVVPSGLGYGPQGTDTGIPRNATLVYDVDLVKVEDT